jgi:SAM-dependent methyltransferase
VILQIPGQAVEALASGCGSGMRPGNGKSSYGLFASFYDDMIGKQFFRMLRSQFEKLVRRRCIQFSSAADLGCGTGLFAKYLCLSRNVPVFGVDNSPAMLRVAAGRCRNTSVTLLQQDIRQFVLPMQVDLVTANFDSINYLLEPGSVRQLMQRVFHALQPGGHFIFDFVTPCQQKSATRVFAKRQNRRRVRVVQSMRWLKRQRLFLSQVSITDVSLLPVAVEQHMQRAYWPEEIASWLSRAGFILRDVLDAETLKQATICPKRIIIVAQKNSGEVRQGGVSWK